jgi:hypothetical protein
MFLCIAFWNMLWGISGMATNSGNAIAECCFIIYLLSAEAMKMRKNGGFLKYFEASISDDYTAFKNGFSL